MTPASLLKASSTVSNTEPGVDSMSDDFVVDNDLKCVATKTSPEYDLPSYKYCGCMMYAYSEGVAN